MSVTTVFLLPVMRFAKLNKSPLSFKPSLYIKPPSKVLEKNKPPGGLIEDLRLVDLVTLIVHSYLDTLLRYVLSVTFCGAVVMKVMDQKTLVKRRWSYKVRITVYILTPSEFCQTRVDKSLIGNLARHSFSFFDRNKTRPQTSKTSEWFNG